MQIHQKPLVTSRHAGHEPCLINYKLDFTEISTVALCCDTRCNVESSTQGLYCLYNPSLSLSALTAAEHCSCSRCYQSKGLLASPARGVF